MTTLRIGLLPWQVRPAPGLDAWAARLDAEITKAAGAQLLVMPEYAPLEMATQRVPDIEAELRTAIELAPHALQRAQDIARRHNIWLLPGTMPFEHEGRIINRAPLIAADGSVAFQDKHVMTRFEAELWRIDAGEPPRVFDTPWGRIGIAVCYDLEFPTLVRAQVEAGAWLVLAPVCTDTLAGFNRIRIAAQARAMENQCFVAIAPTTGAARAIATLDENRGRAGVYGPVDRGFADDGIVAEGEMDAPDWLFADLDRARLDAVRADGAVRNHRDHPALPPFCPLARFT